MEEKLILNSDGTQKPNEKSIGFLPLSAVSSSLSTCGSLAINFFRETVTWKRGASSPYITLLVTSCPCFFRHS